MDFNEAALKLHRDYHGKIEINSKVPLKTADDLSTAYTPGVAQPCREIYKDPEKVYEYTAKQNLIAVVTDGTAVLGLGDIGRRQRCLLWKVKRRCSNSSAMLMPYQFAWIPRIQKKLFGRLNILHRLLVALI